ncbi:MAG TPA: S49 family peptidase, partial [Acidobacteriota bacterium]|nr:S49 family peptidase [Acidobacteriota bacterium]
MLKSLLKFLLISFVTFLAFIAAIVLIAALTMGPKIGENAILILELSGPLAEQGAQSWKERLLVGEVLTLHQVNRALEKARADKRIKALLVRSLYAQIGFGQAQEIRGAIKDFARESKKPVMGFVEDGGTIDYYVCSAAPKLYMPPDSQSWFTLLGLRAEVPFFKGTLDKLGIVAQLDHIGIYKSGSDIYTRSEMSDPDRVAVNSLLDSLYNRITGDIAKDRKLSQSQMVSFINQAPLIGDDYKKNRLIDDFLYRDQIENELKKVTKLKDFDSISALEYSKPTFREAIAEANTKIGIVYAAGTIMPGKSSRGWGESVVGSASIAQALKQAREDKTVKAIVLRVDSPGGSPSASDLIWREVKVTSTKKPVVVSMSDVAASGGYYIAMGASKILASPSTITGSIGVYGGKFYLKGLYDK